MPRRQRSRLPAFTAVALFLSMVALAGAARLEAQSDLDAFMQQVMARRDENWKKLQQYVLDEREEIDIRGPGRVPLWGERRDFTWYIRDGFFVRSPLKVNGAAIGEDDRRKYEADYLRREQRREKREQERRAKEGSAAAEPASDAVPTDIEAFIRQTRQPQFISSAYFLRFKFEAGKYALVGRETFEGQQALRVEYYPTRLFQDDRQRRDAKPPSELDQTVNRLMNKGSRVTLWIDPASHQILQFTFDNVDLDFFPARWLATISGMHASMRMGQPFPEVWLPRNLEMQVGAMLAVGAIDVRYALDYHDYRRADVTSAIRIPGAR